MTKAIFIKGKVQKGHGVGKKMGFPTLNIAYEGSTRGIFVGRVFVSGKLYKAVVHVGPRPTFDDNKVSCECFLLDFDGDESSVGAGGDFVGETIEFELFEKIRDVRKFDTFDELKLQIRLDVEFVKNWYNRHEATAECPSQ